MSMLDLNLKLLQSTVDERDIVEKSEKVRLLTSNYHEVLLISFFSFTAAQAAAVAAAQAAVDLVASQQHVILNQQ